MRALLNKYEVTLKDLFAREMQIYTKTKFDLHIPSVYDIYEHFFSLILVKLSHLELSKSAVYFIQEVGRVTEDLLVQLAFTPLTYRSFPLPLVSALLVYVIRNLPKYYSHPDNESLV